MSQFLRFVALLCVAGITTVACSQAAQPVTTTSTPSAIWLDQLDLQAASQGWGSPRRNRSVDGNPMSIGGKPFERGFGTHSESALCVNVDGAALSFSASVGVDDEVAGHPASVEFTIYADDTEVWKSGIMRAGDPAKQVSVDLPGVKLVELFVSEGDDGNAYDHANWADARFVSTSAKTFRTSGSAFVPLYILTPPPPAEPRINGASVFGVRAGSPFLFTVPATGERPMTFAADDLPEGLTIDSATGRISGTLTRTGTFPVTLRARNAKGEAQKRFRIVCGDRIALTPPMGWNSWNCFAHAVSAEKVRSAADGMVNSGLVNHGWTYINVDDFWQRNLKSNDQALQGPIRDEHGNINPNSRFGDMKALADYIHGKGLKAGIYSSPGPWTCGGCAGSYGHEERDAAMYASWGYDYLKYDWCSYGALTLGRSPADPDLPSVSWGRGTSDRKIAIAPYRVMAKALQQQSRDIVYSLCQYGMQNVWEWGDSVRGNCWRTTNDIGNSWQSMRGIALAQDKAAPWAKPGNWNDADMLILGHIGWGNPQPTRLTTDEQYLHMSLWCLFSSPLLIGCDMEKLDDFTLSLLTNDEVIAINQDPLGTQATCVYTEGDIRVYLKKLEDGSFAVGFTNFGRRAAEIDFKHFDQLGLKGRMTVRDLWRQKDVKTLNTRDDALPLTIPAHGVVLCKFSAAD